MQVALEVVNPSLLVITDTKTSVSRSLQRCGWYLLPLWELRCVDMAGGGSCRAVAEDRPRSCSDRDLLGRVREKTSSSRCSSRSPPCFSCVLSKTSATVKATDVILIFSVWLSENCEGEK